MPRCVGLWLLAASVAAVFNGCTTSPTERHTDPAQPVSGGTLRLIQEVPAGLDPIHSESVYESLPINQIFDTLVTTDASLNIVPSLAEAWRITRDGLEYTFELRRNVLFHDGHTLDAGDVIFTFERVLTEGGPDSWAYPLLKQLQGAEALATGAADRLAGLVRVGDHSVRFTLTEKNPLFLEALSADTLAIVPEHVFADSEGKAFARSPIGTGPFQFEAWDTAQLILRRNPDYFRGGAHLDAVNIYFYDDGEDDYGFARFSRGELDVVETTTRSYQRLANDSSTELYRFQELSVSFLGFNSSRAPLDKPWLRRAIAHAIDRDRMVQASPSRRVHAPGVLPPGIAGHTPEIKRLDYFPGTAEEILATAGYPGGKGLPPIRLYDPSQGGKPDEIALQLSADLAGIGLQLQIVQVTWTEMNERLDSGDYDAFLLSWIADTSDPMAFLSGFGEDGGNHYFRFEDARVGRMLAEAEHELEPRRRGARFREVERYVLQAAPFVPLYHTRGVLAASHAVNGLRPGPFGVARLELERVWLEAEGTAS